LRQEGRFAEYAEVHGNRYGTSFEVLRKAWEDDFDLVFDIDYQGARQLKEHFPNSTGVMVIPPDLETLADRLEGRGSESEEAYARRLDNAKMELSQYHLFDFIVENDTFEVAVDHLGSVLVASRHWRNLQKSKVEALLEEG
jgi:guanylate kinase